MGSILIGVMLLSPVSDMNLCDEVRAVLLEYQEVSDLSEEEVRAIAGRCVLWSEGDEAK